MYKRIKQLKQFNSNHINKQAVKKNIHDVARISGLLMIAYTGIGLLWIAAKRK